VLPAVRIPRAIVKAIAKTFKKRGMSVASIIELLSTNEIN
jgi:hypothetical protein